MTFKDLGLGRSVLKALEDLGFEQPTPIQEQAIPYLLDNSGDLVGLAQTGTGKTAAFGLPLVDLVQAEDKFVQGLVICPTRELCLQITRDLEAFSKHKSLKVTAIYGGASITHQAKSIRQGTHIVVATPGRLVDMIKRKLVTVNKVEYVVLDEADEMLNMGFKEDIDFILDGTPDIRSTWLFSATMPKEVSRIAKNYMTAPHELSVGNKNESAKNITHAYYVVRDRDRYLALKRLLDFNPQIFGLVFCRTRRETQAVASKLIANGYNAEALHGDLSQMQRDSVMKKFRDRVTQILVATDVAARGIDVDDITHVINYNLPDDIENYTHRSGRTARAGKSGESLVLVHSKEGHKIRAIEKQIRKTFEKRDIPSGEEICGIRLKHLIDKVATTEINVEAMMKYSDVIEEKLAGFDVEELVYRFLSVEFNSFLDYYEQNGGDLNATERKSDRKGTGEKSGRLKGDTQRFWVNKGRLDRFNPGALIRTVCAETNITSNEIGEIEVMREFSFFEVDVKVAKQVLEGMQNAQFDGNPVHVELTEKRKSSARNTRRRQNDRKSGYKSRGGGKGRGRR